MVRWRRVLVWRLYVGSSERLLFTWHSVAPQTPGCHDAAGLSWHTNPGGAPKLPPYLPLHGKQLSSCLYHGEVVTLGLKWPPRAHSAVRCVLVFANPDICLSFKCVLNPTLISCSFLLFCCLQRNKTVTSIARVPVYFLVTWLRVPRGFHLDPPKPYFKVRDIQSSTTRCASGPTDKQPRGRVWSLFAGQREEENTSFGLMGSGHPRNQASVAQASQVSRMAQHMDVFRPTD